MEQNWKEQICERIKEADMVLVGLGEEFDDEKFLRKIENSDNVRKYLLNANLGWLMPAWQKVYGKDREAYLYETLNGLAELLKDKNYFIVSVSTNNIIRNVSWKQGRLVTPCGDGWLKQCPNGCCSEESLSKVTEKESQKLEESLRNFSKIVTEEGISSEKADTEALFLEELQGIWEVGLGYCTKCGQAFILNNIYAENYDEGGYLEQWSRYMKWLQGTLNKNVLILELGVGMKYPSVIRWPFEKIAYFNKKAKFYRVNEKLYQLTEELKEKGTSIAKNAIDWLRVLC